MGGSNKRHLLLTILEAENLRLRCQVKTIFLVFRWKLLTEKKKSTTEKLSITFYLEARKADSQIALRDSSEEEREEPGCIGGFATKTRESEHQMLLLKKTRHFQLMNLVLFCVWKMQESRHLEIIPLISSGGPVCKEFACNVGDLG